MPSTQGEKKSPQLNIPLRFRYGIDNGSVNASQKRFKICVDEIYFANLEAKILATFINQIVLNGKFDEDFIEIFNKKNTKKKLKIYLRDKSLTKPMNRVWYKSKNDRICKCSNVR